MNHSHWPEEYNVVDEVVLSMKNIKKHCHHSPTKIKARWVAPFTITRKVSPMDYKVDLTPGWRLPY